MQTSPPDNVSAIPDSTSSRSERARNEFNLIHALELAPRHIETYTEQTNRSAPPRQSIRVTRSPRVVQLANGFANLRKSERAGNGKPGEGPRNSRDIARESRGPRDLALIVRG